MVDEPEDEFNRDRDRTLTDERQSLSPDDGPGSGYATALEPDADGLAKAGPGRKQSPSSYSPSSLSSKGPQIAGFAADLAEGPEVVDRLGFGRHVETVSMLLAARDVQPPLALGLFGDWGSGKSFFMSCMQTRIDEYAASARNAANNDQPNAFCHKVAQIRFNAWQYMDTNLWASLATHVFKGLDEELSDGRCGEPNAAQQLFAELQRRRGVLQQIEAAQKEAVNQLTAGTQRIASSQAELDSKQQELDKVTPEAMWKIVLGYKTTENFREKAKQKLGLDETTIASLNEVVNYISIYKSMWARLRNASRHTSPKQALILLVVLLAVLLFGSLGQGILVQDWLRWPVSIFTAVVGFLGTLGRAWATSVKDVESIITGLEQAHQESQARFTRERQKLEEERDALNSQVKILQDQVEEARRSVAEAESRLKDLSSAKQLVKFIEDKASKDDYSKHLGLISHLYEDFRELSRLLHSKNTDRDIPTIDRIILYIDDLDRCPEEKVVDVLQAVHLLLAFPLFVVVVAVDPKWVLHSLGKRYVALSCQCEHTTPAPTDATSAQPRLSPSPQVGESTPQHYLEKIFQIPFAVPNMDSTGFSNLVKSLASDNRPHGQRNDSLDSDQANAPADENSSPTPDSAVPPDPNPAALRISEDELNFMKSLDPFFTSPRSVKRFINIYRLLRVSLTPDEFYDFIARNQPAFPLVQVLLAAQVVAPELQNHLWERLNYHSARSKEAERALAL